MTKKKEMGSHEGTYNRCAPKNGAPKTSEFGMTKKGAFETERTLHFKFLDDARIILLRAGGGRG